MDDDLAERVRTAIEEAWRSEDPDARSLSLRRTDGMLDLTVVSRLFDNKDSDERERMLWCVLRSLPASDTVQMTYSLLLTPSEAAEFGADLPTETAEPGEPDARKDPH